MTPEELAEAEPVFRWWREKKNPSPLLMCVDEVREFHGLFPHRVSRHARAASLFSVVRTSFVISTIDNSLLSRAGGT